MFHVEQKEEPPLLFVAGALQLCQEIVARTTKWRM